MVKFQIITYRISFVENFSPELFDVYCRIDNEGREDTQRLHRIVI